LRNETFGTGFGVVPAVASHRVVKRFAQDAPIYRCLYPGNAQAEQRQRFVLVAIKSVFNAIPDNPE
jgi:hypothetical protein